MADKPVCPAKGAGSLKTSRKTPDGTLRDSLTLDWGYWESLDWLLKSFVSYERPEVSEFKAAIEAFKQDIPTIAEALRNTIAEQQKTNVSFKNSRLGFLELCQNSINPAIGLGDVDEMLIQHVLTEDIFSSIFDETAFHHENNIAQELERVVQTFFTRETRRATL